ncbi:MAG: hypothetical protein AAF791_10905 [Bacteroidota bacterium]
MKALNELLRDTFPIEFFDGKEGFITALAAEEHGERRYEDSLFRSQATRSIAVSEPPEISSFGELIQFVFENNLPLYRGSSGGMIPSRFDLPEQLRQIENRFRARLGLYDDLQSLEAEHQLISSVGRNWDREAVFHSLWLFHLYAPQKPSQPLRTLDGMITDLGRFRRQVMHMLRSDFGHATSKHIRRTLVQLYAVNGGDYERLSRPEVVQIALSLRKVG